MRKVSRYRDIVTFSSVTTQKLLLPETHDADKSTIMRMKIVGGKCVIIDFASSFGWFTCIFPPSINVQIKQLSSCPQNYLLAFLMYLFFWQQTPVFVTD